MSHTIENRYTAALKKLDSIMHFSAVMTPAEFAVLEQNAEQILRFIGRELDRLERAGKGGAA